jgi:Fe-S oxidoreductase
MLRKARDEGGALIERLARIETPILVLEPSCYSTLKDDYADLMVDRELTRNVLERVFSLEEFLGMPDNGERLSSLFTKAPSQILFHGHCQQKALIGAGPTLRMLGKLPGTEIREVPEGCCGMAGVFGYEKRHYELSEKIGSRHLLPAVRNAEPGTMVVVSGTSCRSQVRHFTEADPVHPAVAMARSL